MDQVRAENSKNDMFRFTVHLCSNSMLIQGGERTSQSRDQNIEKGYTLRNFLLLRTGKVDLFYYFGCSIS